MTTLEKVISIILLAIILHACESKCDVQTDINTLRSQRSDLEKANSDLSDQKISKQSEISALDEKLKELKIYDGGQIPKYILTFHFSPSTLRLTNLAINSFSVEIPVDRRFYESHNVGDAVGRLKIESKHIE